MYFGLSSSDADNLKTAISHYIVRLHCILFVSLFFIRLVHSVLYLVTFLTLSINEYMLCHATLQNLDKNSVKLELLTFADL